MFACSDEAGTNVPRVCLASASPSKFEEAAQAAGLSPQSSPELVALDSKPTKYKDMNVGDDWLAMLRQRIGDIETMRR